MKNENQPHGFSDCPKCSARTRTGTPCKSPAMKNGRCHLHGGKSTGPPKGNQNALKHGFYTRDAIAGRKYVKKLIKDSQILLKGAQ